MILIISIYSYIPVLYIGRHTWATLASKLDTPKDVISEALGHEYGSSTTSIYINFNREKVDQANRKVIDFFLLR